VFAQLINLSLQQQYSFLWGVKKNIIARKKTHTKNKLVRNSKSFRFQNKYFVNTTPPTPTATATAPSAYLHMQIILLCYLRMPGQFNVGPSHFSHSDAIIYTKLKGK
jgi:hypothetical protein